jgi:uncharacterized protein
MKWSRDYESPDVEDQRGRPAMRAGGGGGGGVLWLLFWIFSRFGWKGGLIAAAVLGIGYALSSGGGLSGSGGAGAGSDAPAAEQRAGHDDGRAFVGFVLDDAQKTWARVFEANGRAYPRAHVVLYTGASNTGCGYGTAAVGPFYCPRDEKIYLDLSFFRELHDRFGAPGDFAQAYVIAHEVGHHVQRQLGALDHAGGAHAVGAGRQSVRAELQADCYAGIWARAAERRDLLDPGDLDEALRAAASVGDDRIQKQATGEVHPETWTHGSAAERARWFRRGYDAGTLDACDTFHAGKL